MFPTIDLFLLGMFWDREWSAYELARFVKEHRHDELVKISTQAVYKNVARLVERGLLDCREEQPGNMPPKRVCAINASGRDHYLDLVRGSLAEPVQFHFPCNAGLLGIDRLPPNEARQLLEELEERLVAKARDFEAQADRYEYLPEHARAVLTQFQRLNATLLDWLHDYIPRFEEEPS